MVVSPFDVLLLFGFGTEGMLASEDVLGLVPFSISWKIVCIFGIHSSFKYLVEFSIGVLWAWRFLFQRFSIIG